MASLSGADIVGNATMLPAQLKQITPDQDISSVTGDGAYDPRTCQDELRVGRPLHKNAKFWKLALSGRGPKTKRLDAQHSGVRIVAGLAEYQHLSCVEAKVQCVGLLGQRVSARDFDH
ncbi:hypothetical protein C1J03_05675 [Sulfitobacter sp. SK012]|nr:hypothetical protein C1J03_05675 [Sulfitobacter sp. SK012]